MEIFKEFIADQIRPAIEEYTAEHGKRAPNPIVGLWVWSTQHMLRNGADIDVLHEKLDHHGRRVKTRTSH
jgi:cobalamin biosynthesis Mg chelatase CobN